MKILQSCGCVNTTVWMMHQMDAYETHGEKARLEVHKNALRGPSVEDTGRSEWLERIGRESDRDRERQKNPCCHRDLMIYKKVGDLSRGWPEGSLFNSYYTEV